MLKLCSVGMSVRLCNILRYTTALSVRKRVRICLYHHTYSSTAPLSSYIQQYCTNPIGSEHVLNLWCSLNTSPYYISLWTPSIECLWMFACSYFACFIFRPLNLARCKALFAKFLCPSVRLSTWNNSASTRRISMKFGI